MLRGLQLQPAHGCILILSEHHDITCVYIHVCILCYMCFVCFRSATPRTSLPACVGRSDVAGVHHDPARGAEGLRRDVLVELGAHDAGVAVGAAHLAPHHAVLGVLHLGLGLVDVLDALAVVEGGVLAGAHAVDLDQRAGAVAVGLAALVAEDEALGVQAHRRLLARLRGDLLHGGDLLGRHSCFG